MAKSVFRLVFALLVGCALASAKNRLKTLKDMPAKKGLNSAAVSNPEEYVNTLGGTFSRYDLSTGNILPLVTRPWGFSSWAPQTGTTYCKHRDLSCTDRDQGAWWFHPDSRRIYGVRCTHQPSPWINDWGYFVVGASMPAGKNQADQFTGYDAYAPTSVFKPYLFKAQLAAYGTRDATTTIEVTSTSHGMVMRVTFPPYDNNTAFDQTRRIILHTQDTGPNEHMQPDGPNGVISGWTSANHGGVPTYNGQTKFSFYYYMTVDAPVQTAGTSSSGGIHSYFQLNAVDPSDGCHKDSGRAMQLAKQGADLGDSRSLAVLARNYLWDGDQLPSHETAVHGFGLASRSAAKLNPLGLSVLADCYLYGAGVDEDDVRAVELYQEAIQRGCTYASYRLGECYLFAWGVPRDYIKASEHFEAGAARGELIALSHLALVYDKGRGVPADPARAAALRKQRQELREP